MNRTKKLIKKYYEMNAEDWQKRLETMHSNAGWNATNHTGEDLKNAFIRSYKQECAVIDSLNSRLDIGIAKQADEYREWIYDGASNEPDIYIYNTGVFADDDQPICKIEVKNKHFFTPADKCWKMHYYANIYQRDKQQIIDYIWTHLYHNADYVYYVNPDCTKAVIITKDAIQLDGNFRYDNSINNIQKISYYINLADAGRIDLKK